MSGVTVTLLLCDGGGALYSVHATMQGLKEERNREVRKDKTRERRQRKASTKKRVKKTDKCKSRMHGSGSLERQR